MPFSGSSNRTTLNNRFYEGKVVYHRGRSDEAVIQGAHHLLGEALRAIASELR